LYDEENSDEKLVNYFFVQKRKREMQFTCHEKYDDDKCAYILNRRDKKKKDETRLTYISFFFSYARRKRPTVDHTHTLN
jgi:hypothetical protein